MLETRSWKGSGCSGSLSVTRLVLLPRPLPSLAFFARRRRRRRRRRLRPQQGGGRRECLSTCAVRPLPLSLYESVVRGPWTTLYVLKGRRRRRRRRRNVLGAAATQHKPTSRCLASSFLLFLPGTAAAAAAAAAAAGGGIGLPFPSLPFPLCLLLCTCCVTVSVSLPPPRCPRDGAGLQRGCTVHTNYMYYLLTDFTPLWGPGRPSLLTAADCDTRRVLIFSTPTYTVYSKILSNPLPPFLSTCYITCNTCWC